MRLAVLSDLHLTVAAMPAPELDCDLVILAGDVARPEQAIDWANQFAVPVIYVPGNHEFYGGSLAGTLDSLRRRTIGSRVHVLDRDEFRINGVRFLGCTLWSDFRLAPDEPAQALAMAQASSFNRDFSRIKLSDDNDALFTPAVSRQLFDQSVQWLGQKFTEPFAGQTVVITHHAPSPGSINPRFAGSPLNASFVSDLESKIRDWKPPLWIHGHLHDSYDYRVANTRILCNPRGYARDGVPENTAFDPQLVITI